MPNPEELLESLGGEIKEFSEKSAGKLKEVNSRLLAIEQKLSGPRGPMGDGGETKAIGELVTEHQGFKNLQAGGDRSGRINVGSFHKTAILGTGAQNDPLVQSHRAPLVPLAQRRLTVRDLCPSYPVSSSLVEVPSETSVTNNAGPQNGEGQPKGESAITYELTPTVIETLAHWIPVSKQLLDDSAALGAYLNGRLRYLLKLKEEDELLNGSGSNHHLSGFVTNSTPFDTSGVNPSTDTYVDILGAALTQVAVSEFQADAVVLNPKDLWRVMSTKTSGSGADGRYVWGDPHSGAGPSIWGLPVVSTNSMAEGQFLVGAFGVASAIWDRMDAVVEVSREHSDYFTRNLAAVLCEERLALTVFRAEAFCYGGFPFGS